MTEEVLEVSLREMRRAEARRVTAVHLRLGAFSSIVEDSVRFYWEFVARDTPAEGAELVFERVEAEGRCRVCGAVYRPEDRDMRCPRCGRASAELLQGTEFRVQAIEVE